MADIKTRDTIQRLDGEETGNRRKDGKLGEKRQARGSDEVRVIADVVGMVREEHGKQKEAVSDGNYIVRLERRCHSENGSVQGVRVTMTPSFRR